MNIEDLLRRATAGQVAPSELDDVAQALTREDTPEHRYQLLMVIGKSGAYRYRQLVERWLRADDDPMMVRLALKILCDYWGETERYLPFVFDFMREPPGTPMTMQGWSR